MKAMHQPWFDSKNPVQSFSGFAELQGIGAALRTLPPFDEGLAERLRIDLGDWQVPLNFADENLVDPFVRTEFYLARGLDATVTAFPAAAFQEGTAIAGLSAPPPPASLPYSREQGAASDDKKGFSRTNVAYNRVLRFETQLRCFIEERMATAVGPQWVKQRVPGPIWQGCEEKRAKAREANEREWSLIAYADFTEYVAIIIRKDNWDAVFAPVFKRDTLVRESFQGLFPIRLCTMHARLITHDDELYLLVETKRLLKAMGF